MRAVRSVLIVLLGAHAASPVAAADGPEDEVRRFVRGYFDVYATKDLAKFMGHFAEKSPGREAREKNTARIFAETGKLEVVKLDVKAVAAGEKEARVRVRVELAALHGKTGRPHPDLGTMNRVFHLRKEGGGWKVWTYGPAEAELAAALVAAPDAAAREKLYAAEADLVGRALAAELSDLTREAFERDRLASAGKVCDLFMELAERSGDRTAHRRAHAWRGLLAHRRGEFAAAREEFEAGLKYCRGPEDREDEADLLNNLGYACKNMGRTAEALGFYERSLAIKTELGTADGVANTLLNIGVVYWSTGRPREAVRYAEDALRAYRKAGDRRGEAMALMNIALVEGDTGRHADALRHLQEALLVARKAGDRSGEAKILQNLGSEYAAVGGAAEALQYFEASLAIKRELNDRVGQMISLIGIGNALGQQGQHDEALDTYREALEIAQKTRSRAREASILNSMAITDKARGKFAEAEEHYAKALAIHEQTGDRGGQVAVLSNVVRLRIATDRPGEALEVAARGLELAEQADRPDLAIGLHRSVGEVHLARKDWAKAAAAYGKAAALADAIRDRTGTGLGLYLQARHGGAYLGLADSLARDGREEQAYAAVERFRARALIEELQLGRFDVTQGMTDEERREERKLKEAATALAIELEALEGRRVNPARQAQLAVELRKARLAYAGFRDRVAARLPDLQARRAEFAPATLRESAALFADHPGLVVLSFVALPDELLVFVLTGAGPGAPARLAVHRVGVGAKELSAQVGEFIAGCQNPDSRPVGDRLYRWLVAPAGDALAKASHVVVVPCRELQGLPFAALAPDGGRKTPYLVERFPITYTPSVTALLKMRARGDRVRARPAACPALVVGVGDFGGREKALPSAEPEAKAVAALFGGKAKLLLGPRATRANVAAAWGGCRVLHFATHGRLNLQSPAYSALVLAQAGPRDEGLLLARDLIEADALLDADLAVLSACRSGLGATSFGGEGVFGLTWAWFVAGVPATVASAWFVSDEATNRLMTTFYTRLAAGDSKAEALRQAQLALLKSKETRGPYFWAPFLLTGDWRQ